jgi:NADH-quinone oxidoreductase subunit M
MNQGGYLLAAVLFLPMLGALLIMLLPKEEETLHRGFGIAFSLITFALSLGLIKLFNSGYGGFQLVVDKAWIPGLNARFKIGVDGISFWLVILTTFLTPIVLLSAWNSVHKKVREFVVCMLVLETGMLGAFLALDIFLFYVFWEVMLIPMYLLIGVWGGNRRLYASIKFVIYTMVGSLLMLAAILYLYVQYGSYKGEYTTDIEKLQNLVLPYSAQTWCFAAFALAFAIKVPLFPLHTWLPDAHVEAPTAGSVILAGVLLKFGVYGFMRWAIPLFPHGAEVMATPIALLAVVGIIYGALVAFAQDDVKKLIAYSSVSHLGFCMLGLFAMTAEGVSGSVYAMLSHGLTTSGLFLAIGVLYERRHTRLLAEYGGLWARMPVFAGMFLVCVLGSAGLPGTSGFIGEFLALLGTFASGGVTAMAKPKIMTALAATGVILGAVYLLYMFQKVMFGKITNERNQKLKDLSPREIAVFVPLVVMIFVAGIFPNKFLKPIDKTVSEKLIPFYQKKRAEPDGPTRMIGDPLPGQVPPEEVKPTEPQVAERPVVQ